MMKWVKRIALVLAVSFLALTFVNASWLADAPKGRLKLMAHRGVMQQFDSKGLSDQTCSASHIEEPVHDYLENTLFGLQQADALTAAYLQVDVAPSADGHLVLFHDWTLDCRTNGKGEIRKASLDQIKALDAGYGYTADGGKTFPLRGKGLGLIPTLEEALVAFPTQPFVFNLKSKDPREGQLLADALVKAGRDVEAIGDAFNADEALLAPIRKRFPKAWAWSKTSAKACTRDYLLQGWLGLTPASCKDGTIIIPLNGQWAFAGWPNRLMQRMESVGARVMLIGPYSGDAAPMGLDLPEQLGQVPASFTGVVWVKDIWVIGPALHPASDRRNAREKEETAALIEKRREKR